MFYSIATYKELQNLVKLEMEMALELDQVYEDDIEEEVAYAAFINSEDEEAISPISEKGTSSSSKCYSDNEGKSLARPKRKTLIKRRKSVKELAISDAKREIREPKPVVTKDVLRRKSLVPDADGVRIHRLPSLPEEDEEGWMHEEVKGGRRSIEVEQSAISR